MIATPSNGATASAAESHNPALSAKAQAGQLRVRWIGNAIIVVAIGTGVLMMRGSRSDIESFGIWLRVSLMSFLVTKLKAGKAWARLTLIVVTGFIGVGLLYAAFTSDVYDIPRAVPFVMGAAYAIISGSLVGMSSVRAFFAETRPKR